MAVKSPSPTRQLLYIVTVRLRGVIIQTKETHIGLQCSGGSVMCVHGGTERQETIYISNRLFEWRGAARRPHTPLGAGGHLLAEDNDDEQHHRSA